MTHLPAGWTHTPIDEVVALGVEQVRPDGQQFITYVDISSIDRASKRITSPKKYRAVDAPSRARQRLASADVLMSMTRPNLNAVAMVPAELEGSIGSTGFIVLRALGINPRWLYFASQTTAFIRSMSGAVQGVLYPAIRPTDVREFRIPLPPLAEQHRIVEAIEQQFTRLDAATAALERARANIKRYRASVLAAACSGRLMPTEGNWTTHRVRDFASIQGGIQKQPKRRPADNAFPYLRVGNVLRGKLDLSRIETMQLFGQELERLRLMDGDLLVVEGNGSPAEIGRMAMWNGAIPDCVHQNHIIRVRCERAVLPQYVEAFWNSPRGAASIKSVASSTSGLYTLSVAKVSNVEVPLPPLAEQQRIVTEVERRLSFIESIESTLDASMRHAEALRQSILKRAFEGKLVPQDPNDEPASVLLERIRAERAATTTVTAKRAPRRKARA